MSKTVRDGVVERLDAWGVRKIFGYPGDGINGVLDGMSPAASIIKLIQARLEEMAAVMASAYARFSGEAGVCLRPSGWA